MFCECIHVLHQLWTRFKEIKRNIMIDYIQERTAMQLLISFDITARKSHMKKHCTCVNFKSTCREELQKRFINHKNFPLYAKIFQDDFRKECRTKLFNSFGWIHSLKLSMCTPEKKINFFLVDSQNHVCVLKWANWILWLYCRFLVFCYLYASSIVHFFMWRWWNEPEFRNAVNHTTIL